MLVRLITPVVIVYSSLEPLDSEAVHAEGITFFLSGRDAIVYPHSGHS